MILKTRKQKFKNNGILFGIYLEKFRMGSSAYCLCQRCRDVEILWRALLVGPKCTIPPVWKNLIHKIIYCA